MPVAIGECTSSDLRTDGQRVLIGNREIGGRLRPSHTNFACARIASARQTSPRGRVPRVRGGRICQTEAQLADIHGGKPMWGAVVGDIVGSRFEGSRGTPKGFELFHRLCTYTDDTVCTAAVAEIIVNDR